MLTYSPGSWHLVVTPVTTALLAPDVPASAVPAVWQAMGRGAGLAAVIDGLVGAFGTSLGALPAFVVATHDAEAGEARIVVRGAVQARVHSADGIEQVTGHGVTTWTERTVAAPGRVDLIAETGDEIALPLVDGVAAAGAATWVVDAAVSAAPPPVDTAVPDVEAGPRVTAATDVPPAPPAAPEPSPAAAFTMTHVPDLTLAGPGEAEDAPPALDDAPVAAGSDAVGDHTTGYDDLVFGETRISTVEDAAVRLDTDPSPDPAATQDHPDPVAPVPSAAAPLPTDAPAAPSPSAGSLIHGIPRPAPASPPQALGDHDGETISAARLAEIQAQRGDHDGETISAAQVAEIQARLGSGADSSEAGPVITASATLIVSTGERVVLDRSAVVGRRPRAVRATGVVPHLVAVQSPNQDISRSHVELRVEGADVLAVDLDSVNGTILHRAGAEPQRLHPGEVTLLVAADRLDLGDGVVLSFEGL